MESEEVNIFFFNFKNEFVKVLKNKLKVVEVVSGFYNKKDFRGATDFLVKESSKRWMEVILNF